jgi:hypothetical protein
MDEERFRQRVLSELGYIKALIIGGVIGLILWVHYFR